MSDRHLDESAEQFITRMELRDAVNNLFEVCARNKVMFAGYLWGADPVVFIQVRNCPETGSALTELFIRLCEEAERKEDAGRVTRDPIKLGEDPI